MLLIVAESSLLVHLDHAIFLSERGITGQIKKKPSSCHLLQEPFTAPLASAAIFTRCFWWDFCSLSGGVGMGTVLTWDAFSCWLRLGGTLGPEETFSVGGRAVKHSEVKVFLHCWSPRQVCCSLITSQSSVLAFLLH